MNRTTMMAVIAAIAIVAVASVAAAGMLQQASLVEGEDYTGHWYAVDCETYDVAGTYSHISVSDSSNFSMDIYDHSNGVFNGRSMSMNICGTLHSDWISFSTYDENGTLYIGNGNFSDGILYLSILYHLDGTTDSGSGVVCAVMSQDPASEMRLHDTDGFLGQWRLLDGIVYNGETHAVTRGTSLGVTGQNGSVFKGTVELDRPGGILQSYDMRGAMSYIRGSVGIGSMIDELGNVWNVVLDNGVLTIETVKTLGSDIGNGGASVGVERRSYSQDKGAIYTPFEIDMDFIGTTWKCVKVEQMDSLGNVSVKGMKSFLTIVDSHENYLHCTESTYSGPVSLVVMYHHDGEGSTRALNDRDGGRYLYSDIVFTDDDHFVVYVMFDNGAGTSVMSRYFERYNADTEYDISGHWYATLRAGYDENGNFVLETPSDSNAVSEYDIDIYSIEGGLFRGWFMERYVVGYCEGDGITFMDDGHDECYRIVGTFENSNSLAINEAYWSSDGVPISGYTTYFTKDKGAVSQGVVELEVSGKWVLSDGTAFYPDDAVPVEKPQYMNIESESNGTFAGTVDDKNAEDAVEAIDMRGAVLPSVGSESLTGFILTEKGALWFCRFTDSSIYMSRSFTSVNPEHRGDITVVEKVYTRNGSSATMMLPEYDLLGTWKAVGVSMMCNDGTYSEKVMSYILEVDSQVRNMALGTCAYDGMLSGGFSMTMQFLGDDVIFDYGIDLTGEADTGTGMIIDEDHFVVIEWYHDATGAHWVQKTLFERQTQ